MRLLACLAAALATAPAAAGASADLRITFWAQGRGTASKSWTLRCDPVRGTLPDARRACRELDALKDPFAPVPKDAFCSQVYGGPAQGVVRGTFAGKHVWAFFRRSDGCQVARWNRVAFLFPSLPIVRR